MARRWRVWHRQPGLVTGALLTLDRQEAHHVWRVLRLVPGEPISVFDGRGREWSALIESSGADGVTVRLDEEIASPVEPALELTLVAGLCRTERMEWLIQKATELGAGAIFPVPAERSESRGVGAARLARWERIAVEACKQSGRRSVPRIEPRPSFPAPPAGAIGLWLDTDPSAERFGSAWPDATPARVWIGCGPEAGFSENESRAAAGLGWRRVSLGPRTLRSETAGLVAVALSLFLSGDL